MRDEDSVNKVALRTLKVDVGCFSHTVNLAREHFKVHTLPHISLMRASGSFCSFLFSNTMVESMGATISEETREKSFSKTSLHLRIDGAEKSTETRQRDKRTQEDYQTSEKICSRCVVVFLHSFISLPCFCPFLVPSILK